MVCHDSYYKFSHQDMKKYIETCDKLDTIICQIIEKSKSDKYDKITTIIKHITQ